MVRAVGVYREREFSPGKVGADAAILDAVLAHLAAQGVVTSAVTAANFIHGQVPDCELILAMCQSEPALERLAAVQKGGVLVINSPQAIRSCYRDRLGQVLKQAGAPVPEGMLVETSGVGQAAMGALDPRRGIYVKRGDLHALFTGDVRRVDDELALDLALRDFAARGIALAYLQAAVEGRVVKFYGVTGTSYFSVAEAAPSGPLGARLDQAAKDVAVALGLEVWGGDAIVDCEQFKIVDFNDWPSFERVRAQAAQAIAGRMLQLLRSEKREMRNESKN
ncbi:MAG TPA: hypothetical protein VGY99_15085 [Candidatus Binataceae bacterium]|jgi:hypothetical protein|nr:hypothetical protein [Candidatus Binataceae bacterium]